MGKPGWPGCWIEKFPPAEKTAKNQRIPLENSRWNLPNQFLVGRKPTRNLVANSVIHWGDVWNVGMGQELRRAKGDVAWKGSERTFVSWWCREFHSFLFSEWTGQWPSTWFIIYMIFLNMVGLGKCSFSIVEWSRLFILGAHISHCSTAAFKQLSCFDRFFSVIVSSLVQLFDLLIFVVQGKGVEPWILLIGAPRLLVDILMLLPFW